MGRWAMPGDPLQVLLKLRTLDVDRARMVLAECLQTEAALQSRLTAVDDAENRDEAVRQRMPDAHLYAENFANRRIKLNQAREAINRTLLTAGQAVAEARRALSAARSAAEIVTQLAEERALTRQADADRKAQHALDDIARVLRQRHSVDNGVKADF